MLGLDSGGQSRRYMTELLREYDVVRVARLNLPSREVLGTRPPQVGDVGAICHQYDPNDQKAPVAVEMLDERGMTVWLADFFPDELDLVSSATP